MDHPNFTKVNKVEYKRSASQFKPQAKPHNIRKLKTTKIAEDEFKKSHKKVVDFEKTLFFFDVNLSYLDFTKADMLVTKLEIESWIIRHSSLSFLVRLIMFQIIIVGFQSLPFVQI